MTKLEKFLSKLVAKERASLLPIIERILRLDLNGLDVKKLKGVNEVYRVRKGDVRIIFHIENGAAYILDMGRRGENTY
ncbi:MAG: type II toxin-antitoxin system RelE/ParE family toxin [Candidatus Pacebacteria bacterium]|nr:type II toxin-antitoxin system RelE/ParE family toxin [Candidatus Paceibacterota bacterium]